jgi:hypothetical protein
MRFDSLGGYIGRLAWWNTFDTQDVAFDTQDLAPRCPANVRIWGKGPFLLKGKGWGNAK